MTPITRQSNPPNATLLPVRKPTAVACGTQNGKGPSTTRSKRAIRFVREILRAGAIVGTMAFAPVSHADEIGINGTVLTYSRSGAGDPVLFLHGAITDMRVWEAYRDPISASRSFITYSQRYFGNADWPDDGEGFQTLTHSDDLIGLIEAMDIAPVNLVTHSYAGMVAVHAILKRPDLFKSVIHYEPSVDGVLVTLPGHKNANREQSSNLSLVGAAISEGRLDDASLRFFEAVTRGPQGMAETLPEPIPTMLRENGRTIPRFIKKDFSGVVTCSDLAALAMPTLVVLGEETFTRYAMLAEQMAKCQQNALLVKVPNATHTFPVTHPDKFARLILRFLTLLEPIE